MNFNFLPSNFINGLCCIDLDKLFEMRLRVGFAVKININSSWCYLSELGATLEHGQAILCTADDINEIILNITEHSIYAFNDNIKQGFLTYKGIRIGICGECVSQNNEVITIKNITSLNIRVPHEVMGCCNPFFEKIYDGKHLFNTLIISPPFCGKTTVLKDLALRLNSLNLGSILIIDERAEFESVQGVNIDKILYSDKLYAFEYGIRSMSPLIVITDELVTKNDWSCAKKASDCGVKIMASCHAESIDDVIRKDYFIENVFERYVVLLSGEKPGELKSVYNGVFEEI